VNITFEFPMRNDRDNVRAELAQRGFETTTPPARVGDEHLLEVAGLVDQQQVLSVEEIVRKFARASRRLSS
jgi:DMSO/TMAO reductase YedYZ molybdopterin-dependent catalytic subunit